MKARTLVTGCFLVALAGPGCKRSGGEPPATQSELPPVSVQTEAVAPLEVPRTLRLTGSLRGDREADLAANASGRVLRVEFERGDQVKLGQVLATLDVRAAKLTAAEARAQAASVEAQEQQARGECERYEKLKEKGAISDLEYQQRITQCRTLPLSAEAASARAALAAQNVGDGLIRAPFAGIIAERFVEVGQYVRQESKVATIVSTDPLRLTLAIPEADVAQVKAGAEVSFGVSAYPGRRFRGEIRFISGVVRASTRDLVVEALVDNAEKQLLPGMFADVELVVGARELPSVPEQALVLRDDQAHLFVVQGGRLEERVVALGPARAPRASVVSGVKLGEQVVVSGAAELTNGQRVAQ